MKGFVLFFVAFIFFAFISTEGIASHNRAGEITYKWQSGSTYIITIVTYTKASAQADRCELEVDWGDNIIDTLVRVNGSYSVCGYPIGSGELIPNTDIQKNIYIGTHTFPGPGIYIISTLDPNRNEGVVNMDDSFNTPFFIQTILFIGIANAGLDTNSSPSLLNPPIDNACSGKLFIHNPGAFDPNGDSLSFHMVQCLEGPGTVVQGFWQPPNLSINAVTGDLVWDTPPNVINTTLGYDEYNIAFEIWEHRNGIIVGKVLRDMQITVYDCVNNPPVISSLTDTCVLAGSLLEKTVTATDPDGDEVTLTAGGGPFLVSNPATFTADPPSDSVSGEFSWQTECSHILNQPYSVTFRAVDNSPEVILVDIETYLITVIGPAPQGLVVSATGNNISLSWDPSSCSNAIGYMIYRRNGSFPGTFNCPCETGVPASAGYTLIETVLGLNNTTFLDDDNGAGLIHGEDYCYRVVAYFPDGAQSCASEEACAQLNRDIPVITHVSVGFTSTSTGIDTIRWSKPSELDTGQYPGPYQYNVYRSSGFNTADFFVGSTASNDSLYLTDTSFIDVNLDTENGPYAYKVEIVSGTGITQDTIGSTHIASSIYLSATPSDNQLKLTWVEDVPWTNTQYVIYKRNDSTGLMDIILDTVSASSYTDTNLVNGKTYCYVVKSIGSYSISGIVSPIINYSQIKCDEPVDLTPPCPPTLSVIPDCENFENILIWTNPNNSCADDVVQYNLYYTPVWGGNMEFLQIIGGPSAQDTSDLLFDLSSVAGCYTITALDSFQNESVLSDSICVENCPFYSLPNVFSPDGSGVNDKFIPFPYRFVDKIDLIIYNRWGMKVFESSNPDINWDGNYFKNNEPCSEGVYFYLCYVDVIKLKGIETVTLTGFIHLLRGRRPNTN